MGRGRGIELLVVAIIPVAVLFRIATLVGARLLLLARRTRQVPEAALGGGLLLIATVGHPVAALSRSPALSDTTAGAAILALGLSIVSAGIVLKSVFTWRVFRAATPWAKAIPAATAAALAAIVLGLAWTTVGAGTASVHAIRPYGLAFVAVLGLTFAWGGAESIHYWAMARRRQALGLCDPVLTNRFLLWGIASAAGAALCASIAAFLAVGIVYGRSPLALGTTAAFGAVISLSWYLAFVPPARYLRFIGQSV